MMVDNVMVWRKIERNLFRKLGVYELRFTPMSVAEQCDLEERMLEHFGYCTYVMVDEFVTDRTMNMQVRTGRKVRRKTKWYPTKMSKALSISQAFFRIAELPDAPVDAREMELAIRYELSYTWLGWLLFKHFAVPIIRWLWNNYHKSHNGLSVP